MPSTCHPPCGPVIGRAAVTGPSSHLPATPRHRQPYLTVLFAAASHRFAVKNTAVPDQDPYEWLEGALYDIVRPRQTPRILFFPCAYDPSLRSWIEGEPVLDMR